MLNKTILPAVALAALLNLGCFSAQGQEPNFIQKDPKDWSQSDCFNFLEYSAWTGLGGGLDLTMNSMGSGVANRVPLIDAYAAISTAASAAKPAFMEYLKNKMLDANDSNNLELLGRYQAMHDALATGNNDAWLEIQKAQQRLMDNAKPIPDDSEMFENESYDVNGSNDNDLQLAMPNAYSLTGLLREDIPELNLNDELSRMKAERKRLEQTRTTMATTRAKRSTARRQSTTQPTATKVTGDWRDSLKEAGATLGNIPDIKPPASLSGYRYSSPSRYNSRYGGLKRNR